MRVCCRPSPWILLLSLYTRTLPRAKSVVFLEQKNHGFGVLSDFFFADEYSICQVVHVSRKALGWLLGPKKVTRSWMGSRLKIDARDS